MPLLHTSHIALGHAYPSRKFLFSYMHFSLKSVSHEWNDTIHTVLQIIGFSFFLFPPSFFCFLKYILGDSSEWHTIDLLYSFSPFKNNGAVFHCVGFHNLFSQSPSDEHLSSFRCFAISTMLQWTTLDVYIFCVWCISVCTLGQMFEIDGYGWMTLKKISAVLMDLFFYSEFTCCSTLSYVGCRMV